MQAARCVSARARDSTGVEAACEDVSGTFVYVYMSNRSIR